MGLALTNQTGLKCSQAHALKPRSLLSIRPVGAICLPLLFDLRRH
eukprot:SAG31_NODE_27226_length_429_cov_1.084848_2_plen_44_part_01